MHQAFLILTVFVAAAVEVVEMLTIVIGVGVTRGWRATGVGVVAGFLVLAGVVAVLGPALTLMPIGVLRALVGILLLFGLQWLRRPIFRIADTGLIPSGDAGEVDEEDRLPEHGFDWTAFALSFKGVVLEGLEVAFIVVTFGVATGELPLGIIGAVAAFVIVGGAGAIAHSWIRRTPEQGLKLVVGLLLVTYGTFWAGEGLGVAWPGGDLAILVLLADYVALALLALRVTQRALHPERQLWDGLLHGS